MPAPSAKQLDPTLLTSTEHASLDHSGVVGVGVLVLVETKLITSAVQSVTFSGLDLDTHGCYMLVANLINGGGALNNFEIRCNGLTTDQAGSYMRNSGSSSVDGFLSSTGTPFWQATDGAGDECAVTCWIIGRKSENSVARRRFIHGTTCQSHSGGTTYNGTFAGRWQETSTNLTSLEITGAQESSIGNGSRLTLYRIAGG